MPRWGQMQRLRRHFRDPSAPASTLPLVGPIYGSSKLIRISIRRISRHNPLTWSLEPLARYFPSSDGTTHRTHSECPEIVLTRCLRKEFYVSPNLKVGREYNIRRSNIEYSDGPISAGTDNKLVPWHKPYRRHGMFMARECFRIFPFILRVPYLYEQIRGTRNCK